MIAILCKIYATNKSNMNMRVFPLAVEVTMAKLLEKMSIWIYVSKFNTMILSLVLKKFSFNNGTSAENNANRFFGTSFRYNKIFLKILI